MHTCNPYLKFALAMICCLAFILPGWAQTWNPFPQGETFLYTFQQNTSPDTWLHGIQTDSTGWNGQDSVYYFNRINRYMEQNEVVMGCLYQLYPFMKPILLERENYFGEKMILRSNGDFQFISTAPDTFLIRTQVATGTSWPFSSSFTATLDSIGTKTFLGVSDSVMYISISNNFTLELSRNHGFVKAFSFVPFVNEAQAFQTVEYSLWGIPHMNVGDTLPGAFGVYDFDIGDRFGRKKTEDQYYTLIQTFSNSEIVGKTPQTNGIRYDIQRDRLTVIPIPYFGIDSTYFPPSTNPWTILNSNATFLNLLPYQYAPGKVQIGVRFNSNFNNRIEYLFENIIYYDSCAHVMDRFEDVHEEYFGQGLGETYFQYVAPFNITTEWLYCYVKMTDSIGPCLDLGTLIGLDEAAGPHLEIALHPQPAHTQLQVEITGRSDVEPATVSVFSLDAKKVMTLEVAPGQHHITLPTAELKAGMYLLQLDLPTTGDRQKGGNWVRKKFVVQH